MITKAGKYVFIAVVMLCLGFVAKAQRMRVIERPPRYYSPVPVQQRPYEVQFKVRRAKEEFISRQLLLSPEQTNRFLIVYRRYEQEIGAVRVLKRLNLQSAPNGAEQLNKDAEYDRELFEIRNRYRQEFLKIMPPEKVSVIYKSETIFNDEVYRLSKERSGSPPPPVGN